MSAPAHSRLLARTAHAAALTVRALLAAALAVFLLAGLPYGLIRYIGWPLPHHLTSLTQLGHDVTSPVLGDQIYLDAIAIVIWLLWLLITISFAAETIALIRGVELPLLPGLRPTQALAVILLTAIGITALMARAAPAQAATASSQVPARAPAATAPLTPVAAHTASAASDLAADTPAPSPAHPAESRHTVVTGDNLYDIARADYGNGDDWKILYTLNAGHTQADGHKLTDPGLIRPGWILETTDTAAAPAAPSAPKPPAAGPDNQHTEPHPESPAPAPTAAAPAASAPDTAPTTLHQPTNTHAAAPRPTASSPTRRHAPAEAGPGWVELAEGGALAAGVLAALTLALARARRRRRWHGTCYWPTPGQHQPEPLTTPVPLRPAPRPAATAEHNEEGELDEFGAPTGPQSESVTEASSNAQATTCEETAHEPEPEQAHLPQIAVAVTEGRVIHLHEIPPALALTGPGALGAARAVAAAALSAAEHRPDGARLLISRQDAALLLETAEPDLPARLSAVTDLETFDAGPKALDQLEAYTAYRTRLLEEHDATHLEELSDIEEFPPIVLLAVSRPEHAGRIAATAQAGSALRVHALLLGELPTIPAWHIDADANATGPQAPPGAKAFRLSAHSLTAALKLLAEASGDELIEAGPPIAPDPLGELATPDEEVTSLPSPVQAIVGLRFDTAAPAADAESEQHDAAQTSAVRPAAPTSVAAAPGPAPVRAPHNTEARSTGQDPDTGGQLPTGPLLLVAAPGPDRVAAITEDYAAHPVRIKTLGVRAIITPTGSIDARLRADAWRAAMKIAVAGKGGQHIEDLAALWPDQHDAVLRVTVKNAVYDLRKTLRQRCADSAGNPGRYLIHTSHRYAFNEQTVAIDLGAFNALRVLAARARDAGERRAAATAALSLYDGDLLAGQDEEWIIAPRVKTRRDALATATLLAQLADRAEDGETALTWWERALEIDDNEEVYRQIILLQLRLGRQADAIATCDLLAARLDADGLAPAPETMAVMARARGRQSLGTHTRPGTRRAA